MPSDTWLKLHTSLLTSAKFVNLPSNDHRLAFVCLLLLAKKGLESAPESYTLAHVFLRKKRWETVRKDLIECGMLTTDGKVNGFEDSQLSPSAYKMRRLREREKDGHIDGHIDGHSDRDSRMQSAESSPPSEKKIPPTPRKRGERVPVEEIIGHLNRIAGTAFSTHAKATCRLIESRWAEGRRTEDFVRVIEAKTAEWGHDPERRKYLRPETLFNATKMESYLGVLGGSQIQHGYGIPEMPEV
jgi:uncharacterized phage protein (TIGR02220 family)